MTETLSQYKSNLTPEEVDQALHNIAQLDDGIAQAKQYAEQAQGYAESIDPDSFVKVSELLGLIYPVGSIYMSSANVSPATFIGGTWERIKDVFLLAAGDTYSAGSTGGEATHTLTEPEIPSHIHYVLQGWNNGGTGPDTIGYSSTNQGARSYQGNTGGATQSTLRPTGGNQPHNNMPPYLAVYMWQRTA